RCILKDGGSGQWRSMIESKTLAVDDQQKFNAAIAGMGHEFLAGPTQDSVETQQQILDDESPMDLEMLGLIFPKSMVMRAHEFEWHRVVTAISKKSGELIQRDLQHKDWDTIARDWFPEPAIIPVNLRDFATGLLFPRDKIYL